ncbi:HTH domain-containing protein [Aquisphaera insulae]|uniref:HTH domain-containing protein n=1 Tax=Aquisphaera insulae TaxID=2712864 RepID=UPI0034E20F66
MVDLMKEKPGVTIPELAEELGRSERAIELQINKLKADGVIARIGPARGGHWGVTE